MSVGVLQSTVTRISPQLSDLLRQPLLDVKFALRLYLLCRCIYIPTKINDFVLIAWSRVIVNLVLRLRFFPFNNAAVYIDHRRYCVNSAYDIAQRYLNICRTINGKSSHHSPGWVYYGYCWGKTYPSCSTLFTRFFLSVAIKICNIFLLLQTLTFRSLSYYMYKSQCHVCPK